MPRWILSASPFLSGRWVAGRTCWRNWRRVEGRAEAEDQNQESRLEQANEQLLTSILQFEQDGIIEAHHRIRTYAFVGYGPLFPAPTTTLTNLAEYINDNTRYFVDFDAKGSVMFQPHNRSPRSNRYEGFFISLKPLYQPTAALFRTLPPPPWRSTRARPGRCQRHRSRTPRRARPGCRARPHGRGCRGDARAY